MAEVLCVIPARSHSKGIHHKNIRDLNGKPLLAYTIEAALLSRCINRTIVTTDSKTYGEISEIYGAEVPFLRPKNLGTDEVHAVYAVIDTVNRLFHTENYSPDIVIMLLPTSPLRKANHIDEAFNLFDINDAASVISITKSHKSPYYMRTIVNGYLKSFKPFTTKPNFQRQEIPECYELNGSIYIIKTTELLKYKTFHVKNVKPYIMNKEDSVDIDDEFDFYLAELLIQQRGKNV